MPKLVPFCDWREQDPHRDREARRYETPVASREFIRSCMEDYGAPLTFEKIANAFELAPDDIERRDALARRLNAMVREGQLLKNRRDGYLAVDRSGLVPGRVIGHPDGFGFLKPDEGGDDLYLSFREMKALFHGDRVLARVTGIDQRGRKEGTVVEILERVTDKLVGRLHLDQGIGFLVPDNKRIAHEILVPPTSLGGAADGQIVVVQIVSFPQRNAQAIGAIVSVLGDHMDPGMEIDVAIQAHGLPVEWPEQVEVEAKRFGSEVSEEQKQGRVDLRHLPLVTIDGEDAKDFDDAVFCERKKSGWRLIVAIADVGAYVSPGSALDKEAFERGNSVYFPGRVIPMLPEALSNGLCSLNPHVDRLCLACEMYIDDDGKVYRSRFLNAVMQSKARLTYTEVARVIKGGGNRVRKQVKPLVEHLMTLYELFQVLLRSREQRGAIDLDTTETRIVFGPEKKIERVEPVERNDAHRIIEECMLAANVVAARFLRRKRLPLLYRRHDGPNPQKLVDLRGFLGELGLSLSGGDQPTPKDYAAVLSRIKDRPDKHLIQTVLLRSLSQAVYTPEEGGHFGLAYDAYTHYTSPIRRYPDLLVHRAIRHALAGGKVAEFHYTRGEFVTFGEHCSMTERRADEATRDATDWLKCEFMLDKVGQEFEGVISAVTSFGLFIELDEIYVEGLVHITNLPRDYFHFDPAGHRLVGERGGMVFRLADRVKVRVARVNLDDRKIDFDLLAHGRRKLADLPTKFEERRTPKWKGKGPKKSGKRRR
ncbi:MAG: ribonuclease R [Chromatiales bacterium]|nr:ribonuclease R [Chromatiales bacterium]